MSRDTTKFLVDEMLQRLGRWLRAAGYDTVIARDASPDYYLLRQAIDEGRLLLTCDRKMLEHRRAVGNVILLTGGSLDECVNELTQRLHMDWQHAPFSHCLVCNTLLLNATPKQIENTPPSVRERELHALYCPQCNQVYWEGSHVNRMRHQLANWQHTLAE